MWSKPCHELNLCRIKLRSWSLWVSGPEKSLSKFSKQLMWLLIIVVSERFIESYIESLLDWIGSHQTHDSLSIILKLFFSPLLFISNCCVYMLLQFCPELINPFFSILQLEIYQFIQLYLMFNCALLYFVSLCFETLFGIIEKVLHLSAEFLLCFRLQFLH